MLDTRIKEYTPQVQGYKAQNSVLIQSSSSDEALAYYALVLALDNRSEFLAYFSKASLLLDRVKLKRKIMVLAHFDNFQSFSAELALTNLPVLTSNSQALALKLIAPCETLRENNFEEEHYCFHT